jgi:ABC-2 type transport system ATP-binding protein
VSVFPDAQGHQPAIEARGLTKEFRKQVSRPGLRGAILDLFSRRYETVRAVDGIDLLVRQGETVGYVGPNGAGKSTTIKMLTGILVPTSGHLRVNGMVPWRERARFARTIGVVFGQRSQLWWDLAVQETFRLLQKIYRLSESRYRERLEELTATLGLSDLLTTPVRHLSLGQRMRCELAAALLHDPPLLFLDEPSIGLDVMAKAQLRRFLRRLNRERGTTIILATHDMGDVEAVCQRAVVINQGKILYDGSVERLRSLRAGTATLEEAVRALYAAAGREK